MKFSSLILAGGKATRMGGVDKGLVAFKGRKMVEWSIDALRPFSNDIIISCNRNIDEYQHLVQQVVSDKSNDYLGPLAGMQSAMKKALMPSLIVLPCDTPLISNVLISMLIESAKENPESIIVLRDSDFVHSLHAVIPTCLNQSLEAYIEKGGRSVKQWYELHDIVYLTVPVKEQAHLVNMNTSADLSS